MRRFILLAAPFAALFFASSASATVTLNSLNAFITVVSPSAGDRWTVGSKQEIKWEFSGTKGVKIELSADVGVTWEMVTENPAIASSGTYVWTVSDKKSKQCVIRISDTSDPAVYGMSGVFEILNPALVITHTPVTEAKENEKITFTASVTGSTDVIVELHYDVTGRRQFDKFIPMSKSSDITYTCTLDVGVFTAEGMEYFIFARDLNNFSLRASAPDNGFYSIQARVNGLRSPITVVGDSVQSAYRLISIPLNLTKTTITEQFILPDGEVSTDWRLFRFSPVEMEPKEYPNIEGFSPGISFWLITRNSFQLISNEGVTVNTADPFTIELKSGWNDIANPWMFDISWNDIENPSGGNLSKPFFYEGSWSDPSSSPLVFKPWTGYAVKNLENRNLFIKLLPKPAQNTGKETSPDPDLLWRLTLTAQAGLASDRANHMVVHRKASNEWDRFDEVEPPVIREYVSLAFPHSNWARFPSDYTIDVRPPDGTRAWDFDVRTNIALKRVTVALEGLTTLPVGTVVEVFDRDTGLRIETAGSVFSFVSGTGITERHFTLAVNGATEPGRYTALKPVRFVIAHAYPNPFNPRTVLRYELSDIGEVTITVFNSAGQKVREECLGRKTRGVHEFIFNAAGLTTGLYVYRVDAGYSSTTEKMLFLK